MPNWTKDQQSAIDKENSNIIVSAGAGSGKTAVLTARVIRKLKDGVDVNKLLVLTFTNEAANEMKNRIRSAIQKEESLKKQLDYIDSAYITTFDSYALSIVKKYHYLLNLSKNISIVDSSIINIKKKEFIEKIFEELYNKEDESFLKLINDFCTKDDKELKKQILKINNLLEQKYNKKEFLDSYIDDFYNEKYIDTLIEEYLSLITNKHNDLKNLYEEVLHIEESKKIEEYISSLENLIKASNYEEIKNNLNVSLPRIVKNSKEEKQLMKEIIEELKERTYLSTKPYVSSIINIINKLDVLINKYKELNDSYEFIDISKMAIKIVKENKSVCQEIKKFYNEIMVDEYQDTNDLQEMFISLIEKNNVYMVGDIKQSIYRFRNANPMIFKNKYDLYSKEEGGIKIDLLKNFRSREEVLSDINVIFNKIMDDFLGGADYKKTHQMVFGNITYTSANDKNISNNMDLLTYDEKSYPAFSKQEKEAFIIANDIKNKLNSNYQVMDKETCALRKATYSDFCIIMDRGTDFDLYKKIFEYNSIPLVLYKDEVLTTEYDMFIIKNLINLIIKVKTKEYDKKFKYYYMSIARSYLFSYQDDYIFKTFKDNNFYQDEIFLKASSLSKELDNISCHELLEKVLKQFNFYEKCLSYRDIEKTLVRVLYLEKLAKNLDNLGYNPYTFASYLEEMIESDEEIKYKLNTSSSNSVKIMNIHKSKGLEFPVCYFSGLYKKFNIRDMSERFMFDNKYGIITPYYKEGIGSVFTKSLLKENYIKEEISEKIRLFYVAVTRAKEKMIFVLPDKDEIVLNDNSRLKFRSFSDMINSVKTSFLDNTKFINLEQLNLTKDYNLSKDIDFNFLKTKTNKITTKEIIVPNESIKENKFSKKSNELLPEETLKNMKFGTDIHYLFEVSDFLNPGDNKYINNFLKHDLLKNIKDASIYKEYEFVYEKENEIYHGIIDLMLVYQDHIDIIDYKLSNIHDDKYKEQLKGYKTYIENKTGKKVKTYLYSIEKDILEEIA